MSEPVRIERHSMAGTIWFGAWLFTIGFLEMSFWKALLAILLWPYYLGEALGPLLGGG